MKPISLFVLAPIVLAGCIESLPSPAPTAMTKGATPPRPSSWAPDPGEPTLAQARQGFQTRLTRQSTPGQPVAPPPGGVLEVVQYTSPAGPMAAYLSTRPNDFAKHPAIVWVFGGFGNDIGDTAWTPGEPGDDQSATAFRARGIITMYPSFRGGNRNPGVQEGFLGEVDDLLAAADFLAAQPYVDPSRIYLGGHSTGGTLALLASEMSGRFRAVFAFGPADNVAGYGDENLPFDFANPKEMELRSPGLWLSSIHRPTFLFEGTEQPGNLLALQAMGQRTKNPMIHALPVRGGNHFSILGPMTRVVAEKIVKDDGPTCTIQFDPADLNVTGVR